MRAEDKERAVAEVVARIIAGAGSPAGIDAAIADTIYQERRRYEKERGKSRDAGLRKWDDRRRALVGAATPDDKKALLAKIAEEFAREVLGNFNPRTHRFATKVLPYALSGLLNALSPTRLLRSFPEMPSVADRI